MLGASRAWTTVHASVSGSDIAEVYWDSRRGIDDAESFEIEVPVGVGSKNRLTIVASLHDVVGRSKDNETLFARHDVVSLLLH